MAPKIRFKSVLVHGCRREVAFGLSRSSSRAQTSPNQTLIIRPTLTVSTATLASRLLGFVRDAMVAALLGAGPVADAFLVAFQLVNVVRRLLTEGALNAALLTAW